MDKQVFEILQEQERVEQSAYQSADAIKSMIQEDFINSAEVLQAIDRYSHDLPKLFHAPSLVAFSGQIPVPVRKCGFFHVGKHTVEQIPYLHSHSFYELIYVLRGECGQYLESPYRPIYLKAHQACLLKPGITHVMERCGKNDIILKMAIPVSLYQEIVSPVFSPCPKEDVIMFESCNTQTDWCICMLLKEYKQRCEFYETAVRNYLSLLFIELIRKPAAPCPEIVLRLCSYFEENPGQVNLHGFAARIGYSDDYTGRLIKNSTGKSFMEFVLELKIERAAGLLLETEDSVACIAELLGYANPSGFYKQFFRAYGMSPNEYRKTFL